MGLDIGTYVYKENTNEVALVFGVIRTILSGDGSPCIFVRKYDDEFYFKLNRYSGNDRHYIKLLDFFSITPEYSGEMEQEKGNATVFAETDFTKSYQADKIVPIEKKVEVGEMYIVF